MTRHWKPLGVALLLAVLSAWVVGGTLYGIERNNRAGAAGSADPSVSEFTVAPAGPRVAIIGDSYTGGSEMGGRGSAAWYYRTCQGLKWGCAANGVGGSGWVAAPTGGTFGARVEWAIRQEPAVVVFFGGVNDLGDTQSQVRRAATQALMKLRQTLRDVTIVVIGPVAPGDILPAMEQMRDDVAAATKLSRRPLHRPARRAVVPRLEPSLHRCRQDPPHRRRPHLHGGPDHTRHPGAQGGLDPAWRVTYSRTRVYSTGPPAVSR